MKMYDFIPEMKHMLCFVGKGGHGKSIGASYWPTPIYYASCDSRGAAVYNWWMDRDPKKLKEIEIDTYTSKDFGRLATMMEKLQIKNPYKGGTIILDPLYFVADMLIQYSMASRGSSKADVIGGGTKLQIAIPDDYKTEAHGLKKIMDAARVVSSHFILCAHIAEDMYWELGSDKPRITRKLLTAGKAPAAMLPGMFDELWLFTIEGAAVKGQLPKHKIITRPNAEFDTLRTSCNMPSELDWTNKDLYKLAAPYLNKVRRKDGVEGETVSGEVGPVSDVPGEVSRSETSSPEGGTDGEEPAQHSIFLGPI